MSVEPVGLKLGHKAIGVAAAIGGLEDGAGGGEVDGSGGAGDVDVVS